ncbi:MAG: ABC transporter permease [Bryobacteraceae bacterium]|nr:ABC transporter permease [Bryobacteraceae bacterium]
MILREVIQTIRSAIQKPGFSLIVILTMGLGIGAATSVFSLVYGILIRPFPYRDADRLVRVQSVYTKLGNATRGCSLLDIEEYRRRGQSLVDIGAYVTFDTEVLGEGAAQIATISQLNPGAISILGVQPILGRMLTPEEDKPGGDVHKALISYGLWQSRFSAVKDIVGLVLRTSRHDYTIVGVMPPGFGFPEKTNIWTPMESHYATQKGDRALKKRDARFYATIARIRPGVSLAQAQSDLNSVAEQLEREFPTTNDGVRIKFTELRDFEVGNIRPYLVALLSAVGFVLLICCANIANLLMARAATREKDLALRTAMGASRWRIIAGLLTESLVLSVAGGALGIAFAFAGVRALLALIPVQLPFWMRVEVDGTVLLYSLALSLLTGLIFGVVPALQASRVDLNSVLKEGARGSSSKGRLRHALVVAEVALSLILLVGAGLMMQTFLKLQQTDAGFDGEGVLVARVIRYAAGTPKESAAVLHNFHSRVLENVRRIPGVTLAAVTNNIPYAQNQTERNRADIAIKGRSKDETKTLAPLAGADVSADYFRTMRIPLLRGRLFDDSDTNTSPTVAVINEQGANMFWPNQDPIGQEILWGQLSETNPYCRIVGVVGDVKQQAAEGDNGVELYYPLTQWPVANTYYVIRTQGDPERYADPLRRAIQATDQNAAIESVKTMDRRVDESLWQRRLWGVLFTAFAALALLLAAVGLYGVMSYAVAQRTREIGIRMALGAQPGGVRALVVRDGMILVGLGVAAGMIVSVVLGRFISSLLFGVGALDVATYIAVPAVLSLVALLACWIPATRASGVDPLIALRDE